MPRDAIYGLSLHKFSGPPPDSGCDCKLSTDTFAGQPWCVMAGFVLVLIPTAAVFLLFQKVILRSIVLPSMK